MPQPYINDVPFSPAFAKKPKRCQAIKSIKRFCSLPAVSRLLRLAENSLLADMTASISALRSTVSVLAPPEESALNDAIRVAAFSSLTSARCRPSRATFEISISALSAQPFAHFSELRYGKRPFDTRLIIFQL